MRKKFFIAIIFVLLTAALFGYLEYSRANTDLIYAKADQLINATEFVGEFQSNPEAANEKYLDKIVAIKGLLKDILKDDGGSYTMIIGGNMKASSIRCSLDAHHQSGADRLPLGTVVTIKGICTGFNPDELLGSDVIMNRCVIETK